VIVLLVVYASKVNWQEVWTVIRDYNRIALLSAVGLVIVSYLLYGCYDLLGRYYCGHKLAKRQVMLVSFICYAFNLTLSTWVGGIGMRYRLYSRLGLPGGTITRIFSLSITTNWLGYILLGGFIFTFGVVELPAHWYIDEGTLRILGIALLLIIVVYLWFAPSLNIVTSPSRAKTGAALLEICPRANDDIQRELDGNGGDYLAVARSEYRLFLRAGRAAGEQYCRRNRAYSGGDRRAGSGVYGAAGRRDTSQGTIIAALLAYRVLYYFIPLLLALVCYLLLESRAKKLRVKNEKAMAK
jgi:uncharacterized membrane protein YbhN (UPF0104 family)